jgi:hypothetical protein
MASWYYSQNGKPVGPLDEPQTFALIGQGTIKPADLVWTEGMPQWLSAAAAGLIEAAARRSAAPREPGTPDDLAKYCTRMIEDCRASLGPAPRDLVMSPYIQLTPPSWMHKFPQDLLWRIYRQQDVLWRHGSVVWGCLVQANEKLFSPGAEDCPALAIYGLHPSFDGKPELLGRIANSLFAVKGKEVRDPELMEFSQALAAEKERPQRMRVPRSLSGEHPVFLGSIMVVRRHLPRGFLTNKLFPLLVEPHTTPAILIAPSCYWSQSLVADWEVKRVGS